jgi:hypothetical protein
VLCAGTRRKRYVEWRGHLLFVGDKGLVRNRRGKAFLKPLGKKSVTRSKYSAEDLRQFAAETQYMQGQYAETWEMACQFLIAARNTSTGESAAACCKRAEAMYDVPSGLLNPTRVSAAVHKTTVHDLEGTPPVQSRGIKAANPVRCAVVLVLVLLLPLLLLLAAAGTRRDLPDFCDGASCRIRVGSPGLARAHPGFGRQRHRHQRH